MAEQWLSLVEYARAFGMSDMTVRRRIKNGKIKAVLREGKYYIPVAPEGGQRRPSMPEPGGRPMAQPTMSVHASMAKPVSSEMMVVKGTSPTESALPHGYYPQPKQQGGSVGGSGYRPNHHGPTNTNFAADDQVIPSQYKRSIEGSETSLVHTQALIDFCENALKGFEHLDEAIHQKYKSKIQALEASVKAKDAELASLYQQVEDLQLLVKVFEKKNGAR